MCDKGVWNITYNVQYTADSVMWTKQQLFGHRTISGIPGHLSSQFELIPHDIVI